MTCSRCADLEEQVAYLRSELGLLNDGRRALELRVKLGLQPQEAALVLALYDTGRTLSVQYLDELIPTKWVEERSLKAVDVRVCTIRRKLGRDFIETVWGGGRRLSDVGRTRVAEILARAA